ncbi:hypothetical protein [Frateuria soli]|uniref:hypothetical protein n=1 Tax=Frateuria soli TaxID=1542730 RepID=UPI001E3E82D3|nr:hypothetical protein [Frateuria soli]UGB39224.1 hypothetical protein LQ771_05095 [Frateuria soli]
MLFVTALALASAGCTDAPPTLDDWTSALSNVVEAAPAKALPDGSSISKACVETRNGEPCVPVDILRNPFDKLRVIRPRGQLVQSADRPRLVPYISIRDGRLPRLTVDADYPAIATTTESGIRLGVNRPRIAIVLNGDLAYETPNIDTPLGPVLFMPDGKQSQHLRSIGPKTEVLARLYYTPFGEYRERSLPLSPADSNRFASEFRAMLSAYDSLYRALMPKIDMNTLKGNESLYGETDRVGSLGWTE